MTKTFLDLDGQITPPSLREIPLPTEFQSDRREVNTGQISDFEALRSATLMMVDDEALVLDVIQTFLQEAGYETFVKCTQPERAVDLMLLHKPDLVMMDLRMPGVTGFDVLTQMRRFTELRYIPVIILTAETDSQSKLRALELGATDFLTKPVDASELQLRVRNALAFRVYQNRLVDYDGLTGLLNRKRFRQRLGEFLGAAGPAGSHCVLLHVDLDRFKKINDTFGHHIGDRVLRDASAMIETVVGEMDVTATHHGRSQWSRLLVGRVSGNGFSILIGGLEPADAIQRAVLLAQRLQKIFTQPFHTRDQDVYLTISTGIALYPEDGDDAETLLASAEKAMYQAKRRGRNVYEFFSEEMNHHALGNLRLESDLRRAVERNELVLLYQPRVEIATGQIVGAEALVRWRHPEHGLLGPGRFIPMAEETGLIVDVGAWVLRTACEQLRRWLEEGLAPIEISVNISAIQMRDQRVRRDIQSALDASRISPEHLVLEITESLLMEDVQESTNFLRELTQMGLKISIDDFGTGYSSLAYLTQFPLSELKVDRSFVNRALKDRKSLAIVSAIIAMARELEVKTVAEGVETHEQLALLRERGCDQYQGYLCSRPAPPAQLAALLRRTRTGKSEPCD